MRIHIYWILAVLLTASSTKAQILNTIKLDSLFNAIEAGDKGMGSISIFKNGEEVYNRTYGYANLETKSRNNANTRFRVGSVSKTFTAVLIMKLIENKQLSLDTKLSKFYPQFENADKITIAHLLQHRSGIYNLTNAADYATGWHKNYFSKTALLEKIASKKNVFAPDEKAEYANSNYILLSFIAEDVSKKDFAGLLNDFIVKPCNLTHTSLGGKIRPENNEAVSYNKTSSPKWVLEDETDMSIPLGAGAIVSTPKDLNTFFYSLMNGKIISPASVELMKNIKDRYGLGLIPIPFYNRQGIGHTGGIDGFQSCAAYFPDEKLNIALISNGTTLPLNTIIVGVLSTCFNEKYNIPVFQKSIELTEEELDQYIGTYSSALFPLKITITKKESTLMAQATGQSAILLECYEKHKFKFDAAGLKLLFEPTEAKMTLQQAGREFILKKE